MDSATCTMDRIPVNRHVRQESMWRIREDPVNLLTDGPNGSLRIKLPVDEAVENIHSCKDGLQSILFCMQ